MLSRDELERMKRAELQRLCKTYGIRANLKSEELVELLLQESSDSSKFQPRSAPALPSPVHAASARTLSRTPSTRSRLQSNHPVVHHSDTAELECIVAPTPVPSVLESDSGTNGPATRTRKAKDTQSRLGVGRPTIAGGSGARAVTKSSSLSKIKRARPSRNGKPFEATIVEETTVDVDANDANAVSTRAKPIPLQPPSSEIPKELRALISIYLEQELRPLNSMISSLRAELQEQAAAHQNEITSLKDRLDSLTEELDALRCQTSSGQNDLSSRVERLQSEAIHARKNSDSHYGPSDLAMTTKQPAVSPQISDAVAAKSAAFLPSRTIRPGGKFEYPPPPSTKKPSKESGYYALGKRHRPPIDTDPGPSHIASGSNSRVANLEEYTEALRSSRKRPRLETDASTAVSESSSHLAIVRPRTHMTSQSARSGFTVYEGPEETDQLSDMRQPPIDEQLFTESDFDYFDSHPPPRAGGRETSTVNAVENRPFTFTFSGPPGTSTPTAAVPVPSESGNTPVINNFPFPHAPHSPSPAPIHRAGTRPPDSSRSTASVPAEAISSPNTVPPALPRTPPPSVSAESLVFRRVAGTDIGFSMGPRPSSLQTPTGPAGRTLYGTELDVDRRFGDFGYDGVASGFWS